MALTSSAATVSAGHPVTFTASLAASVPGSSTPTGSVTFKDGSKTLGTAHLAGGKVTFTSKTLAHGSHVITADYTGSSSFNAHVSGAVTVKVN